MRQGHVPTSPSGHENAFVLRQALRRAHVAAAVLACCLSEAMLIAAGVAGFGVLAEAAPRALEAMRPRGLVFLCGYGLRALRAALAPNEAMGVGAGRPAALRPTLLTALALAWGNPHVYLDTVGLIGAVPAQYRPDHWAFGAPGR